MTFGERLAAARKAKGLTQEALGRGLGTDGADAGKQVVLGWEKDRHYPKVDQLAALCERLMVSADELVLGRVGGWPFSAELHAEVAKLPPESLVRIENVMRSILGLSSLPNATEQNAAPSDRTDSKQSSGLQTDSTVAGRVPSPPLELPGQVDLTGRGSRGSQVGLKPGAIQKPGSRRRA